MRLGLCGLGLCLIAACSQPIAASNDPTVFGRIAFQPPPGVTSAGSLVQQQIFTAKINVANQAIPEKAVPWPSEIAKAPDAYWVDQLALTPDGETLVIIADRMRLPFAVATNRSKGPAFPDLNGQFLPMPSCPTRRLAIEAPERRWVLQAAHLTQSLNRT